MKSIRPVLALVLSVAALASAADVAAQRRVPYAAARATSQGSAIDVQTGGGLRPIAVAKWGALLGAAGAAAYGFIRNDEADDLYRELESACNADRAVCLLRTTDGAYANAEFEALYQDVLARDRTSQRALLASQVGVALGVVLFLIDLRSDDRPENIPYEPRLIHVLPGRDGGLALRASVRVDF
jgi:hypothetical protein